MPKVSIIVPVYNCEAYVEATLCSVCAQTFHDFEIICVDDGSTDKSFSILRRYVAKDSRIHLLSQPNHGQSISRNVALERAKGEYVLFLDSDDLLEPFALMALTNKMQEYQEGGGLDFCLFSTHPFYETEILQKSYSNFTNYYAITGSYPKALSGVQMMERLIKNGDYQSSVCIKCFRRTFLMRYHLRFSEDIIHEDELFTLQVFLLAKSVFHLVIPLHKRRVRPDSTMTRQPTIKNLEGILTVLFEGSLFATRYAIKSPALETQLKVLLNILRVVFRKLSQEDRQRLLEQKGTGFSLWWRTLILEHEHVETLKKKHQQAELSLIDLRKRLVRAQSESKTFARKLSEMRASNAWRIGRTLTFIPRKVRGGMRCIMENGLFYTLRHIKKKWEDFCTLHGLRPELSVIIPVYNAAPYLEECLDSVLCQSFRNIEVIAIDDGSTDASLDILHSKRKTDRRLRIYTQRNRYAGMARNKGISYARGKWLFFMDADDFVEPEMFTNLLRQARQENPDICLFGMKIFDQQTKNMRKMPWALDVRQLATLSSPFSPRAIASHIFQLTTPGPCNKLFRRAFVREKELQFQATKRSNDVFFVETALAHAKLISWKPYDCYCYRRNQGTSLQDTNDKTPTDFYTALFAVRRHLEAVGLLPRFLNSFRNLTLGVTFYNYDSLKTERAKSELANLIRKEIAHNLLFDTMTESDVYPELRMRYVRWLEIRS